MWKLYQAGLDHALWLNISIFFPGSAGHQLPEAGAEAAVRAQVRHQDRGQRRRGVGKGLLRGHRRRPAPARNDG